jgi:hypothetical protein
MTLATVESFCSRCGTFCRGRDLGVVDQCRVDRRVEGEFLGADGGGSDHQNQNERVRAHLHPPFLITS